MNVDVSTNTVINRSRELVSRYAANPDGQRLLKEMDEHLA